MSKEGEFVIVVDRGLLVHVKRFQVSEQILRGRNKVFSLHVFEGLVDWSSFYSETVSASKLSSVLVTFFKQARTISQANFAKAWCKDIRI